MMRGNRMDPPRSGAQIEKDPLWLKVSRETLVLDEKNIHFITMVNLRCIFLSIVIIQIVSVIGVILVFVPSLRTSERSIFMLRDFIIIKKVLRETHS